MTHPKNIEVVAFVRTAIQCWIENDIEAISDRFREDAVMSSPFVLETSPTTWVRGRHDILRHLKGLRSRYRSPGIVNIATDAALYYTLLLRDVEEYLTIIVELEDAPLLIRRMIICKSVFAEG